MNSATRARVQRGPAALTTLGDSAALPETRDVVAHSDAGARQCATARGSPGAAPSSAWAELNWAAFLAQLELSLGKLRVFLASGST